ncbi:MAG: FAD-linked oxidase C-terminal domain-containing protein [Actinomycetes bacterium]
MITSRVDLTEIHIDHLKTLVTGLVQTTPSALDSHGHDESAWPSVSPSVVVYANSTEEVSAVLKYCSEEAIPVVPFGAGTSLEGHILPIFGGISLDLTNMNKLLEVMADDLMVRVQTGMHRMELNQRISSHGIFFSVDPGADATLGGMASTGAAGTTTVRYGSMRDNVLALTAVLADGTVITVGRGTRKLSAGYDLTRLLVGSEGTLAVITELTLQVYGIPEKMAAAIVRFPNLAQGVEAASLIVRSGINIARGEFLDAKCIRNVNLHDGLTLAEAPTLLFEFHGSAAGVAEEAEAVREIVTEFGGSDFEWTTNEEERRRLWQARHNAHWAGIAANPGFRSISTDAAVPLSKLAEAVKIADEAWSSSPFNHAILGHVADGNFHCFVLTDPKQPEQLEEIRKVSHEITSKIIALGGTCTGEHGIGIGKIDDLIEETGPAAVNVMRAIKAALDPVGILNPGKIFH